MKTRLLKALMVLFASTFISLIIGLGVCAYTEDSWVTYRNVPFPVLVPVVHPGEFVPLRVIRCSARVTTSSYGITRRLHNIDTNEFYVSGETNVQVGPGCADETSLANRISESVAEGIPTKSGNYEIVGLARVPGVFRTFEVPWRSGQFRVETKPAQ